MVIEFFFFVGKLPLSPPQSLSLRFIKYNRFYLTLSYILGNGFLMIIIV